MATTSKVRQPYHLLPMKVFTLNSVYLFTSVYDIFARYIVTELREVQYSLS